MNYKKKYLKYKLKYLNLKNKFSGGKESLVPEYDNRDIIIKCYNDLGIKYELTQKITKNQNVNVFIRELHNRIPETILMVGDHHVYDLDRKKLIYDILKIEDKTSEVITLKVIISKYYLINQNINDAVEGYINEKIYKDLGNIRFWNTSRVTKMVRLFKNTDFNEDINNWNVINVNAMQSMFYGAKSFNQSLDEWNVMNVKTMDNMFCGAESFNQPLDKWNVINVTNMENMFYDAKSFNQSLNKWNVSNVKTMDGMFYGAKSFTQDLPAIWDLWNERCSKTCRSKINMFKNSGKDFFHRTREKQDKEKSQAPVVSFHEEPSRGSLTQAAAMGMALAAASDEKGCSGCSVQG